MTVSEYMMNFLKNKSVDTAFVVVGGLAMYLNDALCKTPEISPVFVHHEQAAAMSADAYARISGKLGFAMVTAGPGVLNTINGLVGGYVDSAPMMIVSGQANLPFAAHMNDSNIRQYGIQGINTEDFVKHGTKYYALISDPAEVAYHLERAYYTAFEGRPGPVWLEVPLNIQRMEMPKNITRHFTAKENPVSEEKTVAICNKISHALSKAKRPLVLAGQGVRLAGVVDEFIQFIEKNTLPVVTTRLGIDIIEYEHRLYVGHPGTQGDRAANITIQNADVIVVLGSRMSTSSVGHEPRMFGEDAEIYVVDADNEELNKPGPDIKERLNGDLRYIMPKLLEAPVSFTHNHEGWADFCEMLKLKYPVMQAEYKEGDKVNSYYLIDKLCSMLDDDAVILVDGGGSVHPVGAQGWKIKKGQRYLTSGGLATMGYWCAVLGACAANNYKDTIAITGDGTFQMNIQELATIKQLSKPIKIIVVNNNGYLSIRHTQRNFMDDRLFGESPASGLFCPSAVTMAEAYGIKGVRINKPEELESKLAEVLAFDGPVVCEVMSPEWQLIVPRVASDRLPDGTLRQRGFDDMFPYLPEDELAACKYIR